MKHIFISYVRDDQEAVNRLWRDLLSRGLNVWLDREAILPGQRWRRAIRRAIQEGAYFLACFSSKYSARDETYMNEELTVAIEKLRKRPSDRSWFIPVRLQECEVPDREIGGGENLTDLQWVDLFPDWDSGVRRILQAMGEWESHILSPIPTHNYSRLYSGNRPYADVALIGPAGRMTFQALVDTGADYIQLPISAAHAVGLSIASGKPTIVRDSSGATVTMTLVTSISIEIEGVPITADVLFAPSGSSRAILGRQALFGAFSDVGFNGQEWRWSLYSE